MVHLHAGELAAAATLVEEADAITEATGNAPVRYSSGLLAAWRSTEAEGERFIAEGRESAVARGEGRGIGGSAYFSAVLYNGLGRYDAALENARLACEYDDLGLYGFSLSELVEAGVRSGAHEEAAAALRVPVERTDAAGTDWALGTQALARALLSDGAAAENLFRDAIELLGRGRISVLLARSQLLYGEWLRRENRRVDARDQLRAAYEAFSGVGAEAFAERAGRELLATGETARRRTDETRIVLTPQEAQIARLAREGLSNPEIGAQLFISPRTVQYHLRKVFAKLGITSRNQLGRLPEAVSARRRPERRAIAARGPATRPAPRRMRRRHRRTMLAPMTVTPRDHRRHSMVSYPYVWTPVILVLGVGLLLSSVYLALIVFAIVVLAALAATLAAPYLLVRAVARRLRERRAARRDWRPALSDDASAPRGTARRV